MTPKTSPEGHDRRDVPGSCRARSPALHVGRRDRVASAAVAAVAAAVGRRRRSSPSAHAASPRFHVVRRGGFGSFGLRRTCAHTHPSAPRARGGCQGAGGSPGPAVIGGPPCCQRRLDRLALLAGARWTRLTRRRQSPSAALLRCVPAAPPGAETAAVAAIV